jgi:hypothetical protein
MPDLTTDGVDYVLERCIDWIERMIERHFHRFFV